MDHSGSDDLLWLAVVCSSIRSFSLKQRKWLIRGNSWDKALMGQAVLFNFAKDLDLIQTIGYNSEGKPITDNQRYANASLIFYVGYLGKHNPLSLYLLPAGWC